MNYSLRLLGGLLLAGLAVVVLPACEKPIDEDQPAQSFVDDTKARLSTLESQVDTIKEQVGDQSDAVQATVEQKTELAEEHIETLRESSIPALEKATQQEQISELKNTINETLTTIEGNIEEAREALRDAGSKRENYVLDTKSKLNSLETELDTLEDKAEDLGDATQAQYDQAKENAEEAIDEARSQLDQYSEATEDEASQLKDNIDSLLDKAESSLKQVRDQVASNQ
jgi:DNA repair exonuclease SbcCD ATPase subunit